MWTLSYSGTTQSLAAWGISNVTRSLRSAGISTLTFNIPGSATAAFPFAQRGAITLYRAGVVWFQGIVTSQAATGSGARESLTVVVSDAWWYLENLVYAQRYNVFQSWAGPGATNPTYLEDQTTHVILNRDFDGGLWGTRDQIADALDFAIDLGAAFQFTAASLPDMKIPLREEKDLKCAEVIRRQLDYMDAVTWFDYSTSPPTLNIKRRADCTTVTRAAAGLQQISIVPRYDLQVPFVHLKFEKTYADTGGSFLQLVNQYYPDPLPEDRFGGLTATIVLSPNTAQTLTQYVEVGTLDPASLDFWRDVKDELNDTDRYDALTIVGDAQVVDTDGNPVTLGGYLIGGQIADWMDVDATEAIASVTVSYNVKQELATGTKVNVQATRRQRLTVRIMATNATTGVYSTRSLIDPGEDPAEFGGMAQYIYTDLNTLGWDGAFSLVESEVTGSIGLGNVVNLTGGATAWASMNALVQAVSENLESGTTQIEVGVNRHLSAGQLVELLRINRTRFLWTLSTHSNGYGSQQVLPKQPTLQNTTESQNQDTENGVSHKDGSNQLNQIKLSATGGAGSTPIFIIQQLTSAGARNESAGSIDLDLARAYGKAIKLREAKVCLPSGATKYCLTLASEPYDDSIITSETPIGEE